MKLPIALGKLPWLLYGEPFTDTPAVKKLRDWVNDTFAAYGLTRLAQDPNESDYRVHEITVTPDDPEVEKLIASLAKEVKSAGAAATVQAIPDVDEVKRARFLEVVLYGDSVDEDSNNKPLNPFKKILCDTCGFPDLTQVPNPLIVGKGAAKKQDVFRVSTGLLVVRQRAMEIFKSTIGDQIEIGDALMTGTKTPAKGDDRLYWVRPKLMIGDELIKVKEKPCSQCHRPLVSRIQPMDDMINLGGAGLYDLRGWVEHFGNVRADFAVLGGYYGSFERKDKPYWHWNLAMSGAFLTHLKANGIKGLAAAVSGCPAKVFLSKTSEPTLDDRARTFAGGIKKDRKATTALKGVPWDYDKDGYVYFQLTTPELMVLDPMTWEQDTGGPYRVKSFKAPGLYRLHVTAIRNAEDTKRGVAVDSATLLFVDNAAFGDLQESFEWDKCHKRNGASDWAYHDRIAEKIGSRFAICTTPPGKFKSEFVGDGMYTIDSARIEQVAVKKD